MLKSKVWLVVVGVVASITIAAPLAGLAADESPGQGNAPGASPYTYQGCFGSDPNDCRDLFENRSTGMYYVCGPCGTMADPSTTKCYKVNMFELGMLDAC